MSTRSSARLAAFTGGLAVAAVTAAVLSAAPASAAGAPIVYAATGSTTLTNPNSKVTVTFKPSVLSVYLRTTQQKGNTFTANLPLAPVAASFKAYGFLPAKGTVVFTAVKPISGILPVLTGEGLEGTAVYVVTLRDVTIGGKAANVGTNCQTVKPVTVAITNIDFNPVFGSAGSVAGTYDLGTFQNCGAASNLINDTLPGTGNTLSLTFDPNVQAAS